MLGVNGSTFGMSVRNSTSGEAVAHRSLPKIMNESATLNAELRLSDVINWCPRQESNLYLRLRRSPFYPLNYDGTARAL